MLAVVQRELTARNLADRDALTNGVDIDPEIEALRQALLAEDAARTAWFQTALNRCPLPRYRPLGRPGWGRHYRT